MPNNTVFPLRVPQLFNLFRKGNNNPIIFNSRRKEFKLACPDCKVFGHGSATCPRRVGENKLGTGDTRGPNRKAVVSNNQCWQVVGALRKETGAGNGVLGSLGTCPNAPASTSDPDGHCLGQIGPLYMQRWDSK